MHLLHRPVLLCVALFVLGAPFRGGAWPSWALVLTLAVLALDEVKPAAWTARAPGWLARPWLGIAGGAVLGLAACGFSAWTFGQVLWLAGTGVFLHDAWKRGEPQYLKAALKRAAEEAPPSEALGFGAQASASAGAQTSDAGAPASAPAAQASATRAQASTSGAQASASEARAPGSEAQEFGSGAQASASEAQAPASEAQASDSEAQAPDSEARASASGAQASGSAAQVPGSDARASASATSGTAGSRRRVFITLSLFVLAFLLSGQGNMPGAPRLGLVWLAVTGLLAAQTLRPDLSARLPPWLRRPTLGAAASVVYLLVAVSIGSFTLSFLLWVAATAVFLRDAALRGELGPFEPRLLWRGWGRRLAVVGVCFAAMCMAEPWDNNYRTTGYSHSSSSSSTYYNSQGDLMERTVTTREWVPGSSFGGDTDAWTYGGGLPAFGLLALLGLLAWKGPGHPVLARAAPLAVLAPLGLWALSHIVENRGYASGAGGMVTEAGGPWYFLFGLILAAAGVALQGRRTLPVASVAATPVP
jgi:hypothetical protein